MNRVSRRCLICLVLAPLVIAGCTSVIFNPNGGVPLSSQQSMTPHRDIAFEAADGARVHGWFLPAVREPGTAARGTIVYVDGAENIRYHIDKVDWLPTRGYNVVLFNYRGYGDSQGEPSLAGFHQDLRAAIRFADARDELPRDRLVVFGQSLGGAITTYLLAGLEDADQLGAMVIDSAPANYRRIVRETLAREWYTWPLQWPLSWLITDSHRADKAAGRLPAIPKLWIGNDGDQTVPAQHAQDLYALSTKPKALWRISPRPHMATLRDAASRAAFAGWLDRALATGRAQPAP